MSDIEDNLNKKGYKAPELIVIELKQEEVLAGSCHVYPCIDIHGSTSCS